jgi:hypothetical protein
MGKRQLRKKRYREQFLLDEKRSQQETKGIIKESRWL